MARTDAIVLGAGMVGVSAALHLAKRGMSVALVDRRAPGEETSYGNAGIIEGNTYFPYPFPLNPTALLKIALGLRIQRFTENRNEWKANTGDQLKNGTPKIGGFELRGTSCQATRASEKPNPAMPSPRSHLEPKRTPAR